MHESRKLSRKVGAELSLGGSPKKARRAWRDLRRALAPLRDHDVMGEHLTAALRELGAPEGEVTAFGAAWAQERAALWEAAVLPDLPPIPERPSGFRKRARAALLAQAGAIQAQAAEVLRARKTERWHEWRKELKRYRYTLEALGEVPGAVKATLDALGRLQDAEVLLGALEAPEWPYGHAPALRAREQAARRQAQREVRALWGALDAHLNEVQASGGKAWTV